MKSHVLLLALASALISGSAAAYQRHQHHAFAATSPEGLSTTQGTPNRLGTTRAITLAQ